MTINSSDIYFGNSIYTGHGINYGQDIMAIGKPYPIGWVETRYQGRLKPLVNRYQFIIDHRPPDDFHFYESEDAGWFFVYFDNLDSFILGYNTLIKE